MGKHRNPYPAEFRAQMVELVKAGRTPEELACVPMTKRITVGG